MFLTLKRNLVLVSASLFYFLMFQLLSLIVTFFKAVQAMHMAEELANNSYRQIKEEEGRCIATVDAFIFSEKRIQNLNTKLTEANREKKKAKVALQGAKRRAKSQDKQLHQTKD